MWSLWVPIWAGRVGQVVVEKRSLNAYVNGKINRDREKAVEMARWSLRRGGRSGRFDCILKLNVNCKLTSATSPLVSARVQIAAGWLHGS